MIAALLLLPLVPILIVGGTLLPIYRVKRYFLSRRGRDHAEVRRRFLLGGVIGSLLFYAMLAAGVLYPPHFSWLLDFLERGGGAVILPIFIGNLVTERVLRDRL